MMSQMLCVYFRYFFSFFFLAPPFISIIQLIFRAHKNWNSTMNHFIRPLKLTQSHQTQTFCVCVFFFCIFFAFVFFLCAAKFNELNWKPSLSDVRITLFRLFSLNSFTSVPSQMQTDAYTNIKHKTLLTAICPFQRSGNIYLNQRHRDVLTTETVY